MARTADPTMRTAIMQAARACFAEKGYSATRMSDIANRAGIAVGSIYRYFKTKEAVCGAFADVANERILKESMPLLDEGRFFEAIDRSTRMTLQIMREELDTYKLAYLMIGFGPYTDFKPSDVSLAMLEQFSQTIRVRITSGECRPCDPLATLQLVANLIERTFVGYLLLGAGDIGEIEDAMISFIQHALAIPP